MVNKNRDRGTPSVIYVTFRRCCYFLVDIEAHGFVQVGYSHIDCCMQRVIDLSDKRGFVKIQFATDDATAC